MNFRHKELSSFYAKMAAASVVGSLLLYLCTETFGFIIFFNVCVLVITVLGVRGYNKCLADEQNRKESLKTWVREVEFTVNRAKHFLGKYREYVATGIITDTSGERLCSLVSTDTSFIEWLMEEYVNEDGLRHSEWSRGPSDVWDLDARPNFNDHIPYYCIGEVIVSFPNRIHCKPRQGSELRHFKLQNFQCNVHFLETFISHYTNRDRGN